MKLLLYFEPYNNSFMLQYSTNAEMRITVEELNILEGQIASAKRSKEHFDSYIKSNLKENKVEE
jgi:hypothetical protein